MTNSDHQPPLKTESTYNLTEDALEGLDEAQQRSVRDTWELCGRLESVAPPSDKAEMKALLMNRIQEGRQASSTARPALRLIRSANVFHSAAYRAISVAAALVVAVAVLLSPESEHYRADAGSAPETILLEDGSSVLLAAGSRLTVSDSFGDTHRDIVLHGEAFFDVAEGTVPFTVKTLDAETTVLGTSFSVRSWPGSLSEVTHVIVETGRVAVAVDDLKAIVEPGQALTASAEVLTPVITDPQSRLVWRQGGFSYDNELIGTIIEDVERRFDVTIKAPASIRLRPITIHRNEVSDAAEFLGDIAATISVRYRPTANGFEMYLD